MTKFDIDQEIDLYRFIISNNKQVEYIAIIQEFGEPIHTLVRECIRHNFINYIKNPNEKINYIRITKSGIKRYRKRHYLRLLVFLRSLYFKIKSAILIENKTIKNNTILLILGIITYIIGAYIYDKYFKN